jgi:hypothetical protein
LEKATFQNVESLSRFFLQSALGFYIDHLEDAFSTFFNLPDGERIHFDVETALLRGDIESRMNAYSKAIQNGVFSPNDARRRESLPPVENGDEPRVQQQLVPLSYGMLIQPPGIEQPSVEPESVENNASYSTFVAKEAIRKAMEAV